MAARGRGSRRQLVVHVADGNAALTDEAAEGGEGTNLIQSSTDGFIVLTQTCDIVRSCVTRPFIEVAPIVEVDEGVAHEVERGHRPNYAAIPALRAKLLVADLDRVMTVEKSIVATWTRTPGCATDDEARAFAQALARKRVRFAFPDDFNRRVKRLHRRFDDKHDKMSEEGRALRALREIRVTGSPSWDNAGGTELFFWFVRNDRDVNFEGQPWESFLEAWMKLVSPEGRFTKVAVVVLALADMNAEEYVSSDWLDLDYLSTRERSIPPATPPRLPIVPSGLALCRRHHAAFHPSHRRLRISRGLRRTDTPTGMFAGLDLALRIDTAEARLSQSVALALPAGGADPAFAIPLGSGFAVFGKRGSPINKVIGFGIDAGITGGDLAPIRRGVPRAQGRRACRAVLDGEGRRGGASHGPRVPAPGVRERARSRFCASRQER